ncbi:HAEPLYID family protein [Hymenobacter roseosalivarius]|uniref:HAEPLYID family protein n=1 Tax=Hymenobacter roseosalivarius TaxID=89967 RepID=UPI001F27E934|nr:HAEPLYID family protein [Hymenobacter roseosalivarius]
MKTAFQYSFFVSEKLKTSMAIGYINKLTMNEFRELNRKFITGNVYSPFFVAARRWGANYHSLLYTGPEGEQDFATGRTEWSYQLNTSFHYMIPGTRNFLGLEFNKGWRHGDFDLTIRSQMRVSVADNLLIGIVGGIPVRREEQRLSSFLRLIYEPGHRRGH